MKKTKYALLPLLFFVSAPIFSQNWQLVWQDEFTNGIGPDWVFETGTGSGGWGNNELQYYRRENATVSNGQLVITARREAFGGMQYTSARMKTQGRKSWKYGRIEARIAMPSFQGVWPAFWMLGDNITSVGWPACGEIDVMEHVNTGGAVHGTIHWQDHNNQYANYGGVTNTSITAFHVYSIEWNSSSIKWFVDGVQFHEVNIANGINGTSEFQNNFFILLNMAIGGNWPGFTIDNNAFPATMLVDYVRVYQNTGTPSGPATAYQHCNFTGSGVALPVGSYTLSQLQARGIPNDYVYSLRVQSGYQVRLYQHDNFTGTSVVKTADDACLVDDNFNDAASSIVVSQVTSSFSQTVQAENFSSMLGVQTEATSDAGGGLNVGWIDTNDWMAYNNINIPSSGTYLVEYRVASPGGGRLSLDLNGGATVLGALNVPATGGWQTWQTISHTVNINAGTYNFGIFAQTGGWNINWWRISAQTSGRVRPDTVVDDEFEFERPESKLSFYPNPVTSELNIDQPAETDADIRIINSRGEEVFSGKVLNGKIDLSSFPVGIYTIQAVEKGKRVSTRFIKE
jgi:beta-glucanase (GH16 family)